MNARLEFLDEFDNFPLNREQTPNRYDWRELLWNLPQIKYLRYPFGMEKLAPFVEISNHGQ